MDQSIPDLLSFLLEQFHQVKPGPDETAVSFVDFARQYLGEHRPVENWASDRNVGVTLANNQRVLLCPRTDIAGTMQDSGAIGISKGRSQAHQEGVL